jgi:hypothetical protein
MTCAKDVFDKKLEREIGFVSCLVALASAIAAAELIAGRGHPPKTSCVRKGHRS